MTRRKASRRNFETKLFTLSESFCDFLNNNKDDFSIVPIRNISTNDKFTIINVGSLIAKYFTKNWYVDEESNKKYLKYNEEYFSFFGFLENEKIMFHQMPLLNKKLQINNHMIPYIDEDDFADY